MTLSEAGLKMIDNLIYLLSIYLHGFYEIMSKFQQFYAYLYKQNTKHYNIYFDEIFYLSISENTTCYMWLQPVLTYFLFPLKKNGIMRLLYKETLHRNATTVQGCRIRQYNSQNSNIYML